MEEQERRRIEEAHLRATLGEGHRMARAIPRLIHHTVIPPFAPGVAHERELECYRREVGGLLAAGHDGRWVLLRGDEVVGVYPTMAEADMEGLRLWPSGGFLSWPIREWEPFFSTLGVRPCRK